MHTNIHRVERKRDLFFQRGYLQWSSKQTLYIWFLKHTLHACTRATDKKKKCPCYFFKNVIQKIHDYRLFSVGICYPVESNTLQSLSQKEKYGGDKARAVMYPSSMVKHICKIRTKYSGSSIYSLVSQHPLLFGYQGLWMSMYPRISQVRDRLTLTNKHAKHWTHSSSSDFCFKNKMKSQNYLQQVPVSIQHCSEWKK